MPSRHRNTEHPLPEGKKTVKAEIGQAVSIARNQSRWLLTKAEDGESAWLACPFCSSDEDEHVVIPWFDMAPIVGTEPPKCRQCGMTLKGAVIFRSMPKGENLGDFAVG